MRKLLAILILSLIPIWSQAQYAPRFGPEGVSDMLDVCATLLRVVANARIVTLGLTAVEDGETPTDMMQATPVLFSMNS